MSYLAPLFLFGAAAVALPILFHLIRRSSRERIPFSSLMFLSPSPPRVTRRSRLENIFLLFLRCLILCLLAVGFARPFLRKPIVAAPEPKTTRQVILLLDTSASMRRQNLWASVRAKAEEHLNKVSPSDRVAVFAFDRQVRTLVSFEQWSTMGIGERVSLTAQRLTELAPSWSNTHLGHALTTAAEAFEELPQEDGFGQRQIVLITDLQEGSHLDGLQGYEWPRGVELLIEPVKARKTSNAGLQLVQDYEESLQSTNEFGPRVRVTNSSDAKREEFKVRWEAISESAPVELYVPPGQSRTVPAPALAAGVAGDRLVLQGDDDEFDNTVFYVPPKAEEIAVLYLGNEPETDPAQPLYYLKRAFPKTRRQIVQLLVRRADAALTPGDITGAHLIIVADPLSEQPLRAAQQSLAAGKTALLVMKTAAAAQTVSQLTGAAPTPAEEVTSERYAMFGEIKFDHPLFAPFADPRFSDFTKIHFWKHRRIDSNRLPGARVLARFDSGNPALLEIPVGKGTLLVLTSGWHPADSQLALSSKFVPLLYSILEQGGALRSQRSQFAIGDEVLLARTNNASSLTVRRPDGVEAQPAQGSSFTQTDLPGVYTLPAAQPPFSFAVNLDAAESRTAPLAMEELERLGLPLKKDVPKQTARQIEQKRQHLLASELENQQRLWRWFIFAAFAVLLLETFVAARVTRRAVAPTDA
ncbi:MAG: BatA domain-containing protein [Verrucomicrobia bacterium]|nr:BatA domain-containing protein [Verrucomicrobiota bacterium]